MSETNARTVIGVIPARYASSRFPGKPLALIGGKPMIQWVVERATAARSLQRVVVATDDDRIATAVRGFGGSVAMTSPDHPSGTDRIAEAVAGEAADLVVNIQGDEPLLPPRVIDDLVALMQHTAAEMGTVAVPLDPQRPEFRNPNVVKVVVNAAGEALYFSRATIPYQRADGDATRALWHWGIYAYRKSFLARFITWPPGILERCEKLEQLRALEHSARIQVLIEENAQSIGVDTPDDVHRVEQLLRERREI
jgi:3-deoxy-manno-octulosonate cytidylyltransferase (CMP-KDO synthetase)